MGLFMNPRRQPEDTRATYNRRRAPWLVLAAIGCTGFVLSRGYPDTQSWMALMVLWIAAILSVALADWSDLRKNK